METASRNIKSLLSTPKLPKIPIYYSVLHLIVNRSCKRVRLKVIKLDAHNVRKILVSNVRCRGMALPIVRMLWIKQLRRP